MRALLLLLTGCSASVVGCDLRAGSVNGPEPRCQDRTGVESATFASACETVGGAVHRGGCPLEEAVGGCDFGVDATGGEVVDWYYPPVTVEEVTATCAADGTIFVTP